MNTTPLAILALALGAIQTAAAAVSFASPGFAPSRIDDQGCLVEDWGRIEIELAGDGFESNPSTEVQAIQLDDIIPAARAQTDYGPALLERTAFRAPAWPKGLDVLSLRVTNHRGQDSTVQLKLGLPENARLGSRSVSIGNRMVMMLPAGARATQETRDWGWDDDAVSLSGWGKPAVECDPAFKNIRAGLQGVPIFYRFQVEPRSACQVVLGFCESHWEEAAQRPLVCRAEGAPAEEVDPVSRWGQHQPGAVLLQAKDENGDGHLEVSVLPKLGATDRNPILNVLWIFPPGDGLKLDQVIKGRMNGLALHYVDAGGSKDQSLYAGGQLHYALKVPANGMQDLAFLVATQGGAVPAPDQTAWTAASLRQAAAEVWRDWPTE